MSLPKIKISEIECKSAIGKCGFPSGGWAINPYVGCGHACVYCYARFMRRFTSHQESWGCFVDVRINIAKVLTKQLKSSKYQGQQIYIGTVTDPYQPIETKYQLMRKILPVLSDYKGPISILTKSDLVVRDLDLLKKFKKIDVNFTINTLDEKWKKLIEPNSLSIAGRLKASKLLTDQNITVNALMGPFWPIFSDAEALFEEFQKAGISHIFTESLNTIGGNWTGVEEIIRKNYPAKLDYLRQIFFDQKKFSKFYNQSAEKITTLSKKYQIPVTIYFGLDHTTKM